MSAGTGFAPAPRPEQPLRPTHGLRMRLEESAARLQIIKPGRFGRLFPLPTRDPVPNTVLAELAAAMVEASPADPSLDNRTIPAGFTYFGQFVDHDITFDPTPVPEQVVDPAALHNFRTPALDLDCVYGLGPAVQPYLYESANPAKLLLGTNTDSSDQNGNKITLPGNGRFDLPRNSEGFALIGDPRNDENLIVSQLHLAFLKFHNAVVDVVEPNPARQGSAFAEIRREVTWHYQWMIVHDFLARLVRPEILDSILNKGRRHYHFETDAFMPVEFSVAAYRFGHSMIRNGYDHNRVFGPGPGRLGPGSLDLLFFFTGPTKQQPLPGGGALISSPLPSNWVIDWTRFFDVGDKPPVNASRKLDAGLAPALMDLIKAAKVDAPPTSLPERNLRRGEAVVLPTGQSVAGLVGAKPLDASEIAASGPDGKIAEKHGLHKNTPLWYYILKEAQIREKGERLGEVGSHLVSEVFIGLLQGDRLSYLSQDPCWTPTLGKVSGQFSMADMLRFVDSKTPIVNPIGN